MAEYVARLSESDDVVSQTRRGASRYVCSSTNTAAWGLHPRL